MVCYSFLKIILFRFQSSTDQFGLFKQIRDRINKFPESRCELEAKCVELVRSGGPYAYLKVRCRPILRFLFNILLEYSFLIMAAQVSFLYTGYDFARLFENWRVSLTTGKRTIHELVRNFWTCQTKPIQ